MKLPLKARLTLATGLAAAIVVWGALRYLAPNAPVAPPLAGDDALSQTSPWPVSLGEQQITVALASNALTPGDFDRGPPPREPREYIARQIQADTLVGQMVQRALGKRGDSDRRILDGLSALHLHPSAIASWSSLLDPWLAVALVDLERQMARRCERLSGDVASCFAPALAAERRLQTSLHGESAAVLSLFHQHDIAAYDLPSDSPCEDLSRTLAAALPYDPRSIFAAIARASPRCPAPDAAVLAALSEQMRLSPAQVPPLAWARMASFGITAGDEDSALWAYHMLEQHVADSDDATHPEQREALARLRVHLIVAGFMNATDWRDAMRAAAIYCDPGWEMSADIPQTLSYSARFADGTWQLQPVDLYAACIERTIDRPEPSAPTDVTLLILLSRR